MADLFVSGLIFGTGILVIIAGVGVRVRFNIPYVMSGVGLLEAYCR